MPDLSLAELPAQIAMALSLASSTTGTDLDYLMRTAERESSFQADARAATSSAEGLFQFIEETWIRTIKDEGACFGLEAYADLIEKREDGRYVVADAKSRRAILALRRDPNVSAVMAGAYARRNAEMIREEIGRRPTSAELYIAHFLGPSDAVRLIKLRDTQSYLSAPDLFPKAADANGKIFYANGRPRSVGQVYDVLVSRHEKSLKRRPTVAAGTGTDAGFGSWNPKIQQIVYLKEPASGATLHTRNGSSDPVAQASGWTAAIEPGVAGEVVTSMPVTITAGDEDGASDMEPAADTGAAGNALLRGTESDASQGARRISVAEALTANASSPSLKIIRVSK
jgi:hypothetical protein